MTRTVQSSFLAIALVAGWVSPAQAAAAKQPDVIQQLAAIEQVALYEIFLDLQKAMRLTESEPWRS